MNIVALVLLAALAGVGADIDRKRRKNAQKMALVPILVRGYGKKYPHAVLNILANLDH